MNVLTLLRARRDHRRNARCARLQLQERQLAKFRSLAAFVAARSPYYRDIIAERHIDVHSCTPGDFPALTKSDFMANFDRIVTDPAITRRGIEEFFATSHDSLDLFRGRYLALHTSGSSGEMGYFVFSQNDWLRGLAQALRVNPLSLAKRRLGFFGATRGHFAGVTMATTCKRWPLNLLYDVATFDITRPLSEAIEGMQRFQPTILVGYASSLAILAEKQRRGQLHIAPKYVQSSAEPIQAADRAVIEEAFGIPLFNVYSCTEHGIMGLAKPEYDGMYLLEDDLIFELAPDFTLVTNLFNRTMPLIRYRMNDRLVPVEDATKVLPFTKIAEVVGRAEQLPTFVNRHGELDFLPPVRMVEFRVNNVRRHQLQRLSNDACVLRICLASSLATSEQVVAVAEARERFLEMLTLKDMQNVSFRVEVRDDLLPDAKTGKFKVIVGPESP